MTWLARRDNCICRCTRDGRRETITHKTRRKRGKDCNSSSKRINSLQTSVKVREKVLYIEFNKRKQKLLRDAFQPQLQRNVEHDMDWSSKISGANLASK